VIVPRRFLLHHHLDVSSPHAERDPDLEAEYLRRALATRGGSITRTAERIKLARRNLLDKVKKYGLKASQSG